ncbi:hypothetical protein M3Y98_01087000 [Aphelenchoides besseyi]|nr:hypothetical protein M3Y98_01087000 [Aphelenchoides besseyi]
MFSTTISPKTWIQTQRSRSKNRRINVLERRNLRNQVILLMGRAHRRNAELKVEINQKKERKRKPQEEPEAPVKPKWIRPPLPQPDVYEMPPKGAKRNPHMNIKDGHVKLKQGVIKSENTLTLFEEGAKTAASQKGEHAFGAQRNNYVTVVDSHQYESDSKLKLCESIIPMQSRAALCDQSNMSIGNLRAQGTEIKFDRASDGSVSRIFSIDTIEQKKGADFGSFRPLIQEVEGDVRTLTYDEERLIKLVVPYQTAASLR